MDTAELELLPDGVVIADEAGLVVVVNSMAASMLSLSSDPVGRPLGEVLGLTDHSDHTWIGTNCPYGGLTIRTGVPEQAWLLPDGTEVLVTARLQREQRGGPVSAVAVSLRSGRGRERLDRDRSDLVATVAHELRSPLSGVKGFVTALLNRWEMLSDDQKRLMLTTVAADADRLSRLIAELLDVARIDTGRLQLHRRPTDLALKCERAVATVAAATSRPIDLKIVDHPTIEADPDKVIQVLINVIQNAVLHGSGTVTVELTGEPTSEPTGESTGETAYAVVVVSDEGDGIPAELRQRVFTKFWTSGTGGSSGLGMYVANGLMRAHGGEIIIGDRAGGGARVELRWPLATG